MVIGFDGSRAFRKDRTGTENYSYQLLKTLAKIDKSNTYIVYVRPNSGQFSFWPKNFQFKILNFQFLWTQGGLGLQTFKEKLDCLFVPSHTLPLVRKLGLKTVVTVHDLGSEYLPGMHQLKQRLYLGLMQKFQLKTATHIIAVSNSTKSDIIHKLHIQPDRISVIYEGYDKEKFKNQSLSQRTKAKNYFLFVGTIQPRKNLERIIKAIAKVKETLVIAGQKGWMSEDIYALPKQLGIEDRVKFLGYVPDKELPALYSGAIALVFPSLFEGFGLPILEAQACGVPVLTSNISSMPEVGGKGVLYVNPYNVDDIVKGIERIKREGEGGKLIRAGFDNIKRFSWEKCATDTLKVFQGL